jgi:hypothetical protein
MKTNKEPALGPPITETESQGKSATPEPPASPEKRRERKETTRKKEEKLF